MKEKMPTPRPEKKGKPSAAALAKEWEKKLAKEGLTAEPQEDKAAALLRQQIEAEGGMEVSETEIRQKIQEHLVGRPESLTQSGLHRQIANAVAQGMGISTDEIPNDLIDTVLREIPEVERRVRAIISSKSGSPVRFHYDKMNDLITRNLGSDFSDFSPMALQEIIARALEESN